MNYSKDKICSNELNLILAQNPCLSSCFIVRQCERCNGGWVLIGNGTNILLSVYCNIYIRILLWRSLKCVGLDNKYNFLPNLYSFWLYVYKQRWEFYANTKGYVSRGLHKLLGKIIVNCSVNPWRQNDVQIVQY